ncbi:hypothetical protein [Gracilimonas sp.]|uniref:hypothetical protein n=1 Tax=Gracilimonas sp. TaxID=1974203 RepID=UPI003BAB1C0C
MNGKIGWKTVLAIVIFVVIVFLFISSLGQYNPTGIAKQQEFKDDREEAERKHQWFTEVLKNQEKLKTDLQLKFKWIYAFVRAFVLLVWSAFIYSMYAFGIATGILGLIALSSLPLWFVIAANFLVTGTYRDLKDFIRVTEIKLENWVYGRYIDIDARIASTQEQINRLQ